MRHYGACVLNRKFPSDAKASIFMNLNFVFASFQVVGHREVVKSDGADEALLNPTDKDIQPHMQTMHDSPVVKAIDKAPRPGSRGTTVAFMHPKGSFGTLIELVQE